jgi:hypothetical protein
VARDPDCKNSRRLISIQIVDFKLTMADWNDQTYPEGSLNTFGIPEHS